MVSLFYYLLIMQGIFKDPFWFVLTIIIDIIGISFTLSGIKDIFITYIETKKGEKGQ